MLNSQQIVPLYQGTQDREIDIIHTKLLVDLNWEKQQLNGEAYLSLKPYYYSLDTITLDAKAMTIKEVKVFSRHPLFYMQHLPTLFVSM